MAVKKKAVKTALKKRINSPAKKRNKMGEADPRHQIHVGTNFELDAHMDSINAQHIRDEQLKEDNVLTQAQAIIYGDREKTYGRPEVNLESIAEFWKVYLRRKGVVQGDPTNITINDVCQMMVLLKTGRLLNQPDHHDSQTDQVGYIALQERCRA